MRPRRGPDPWPRRTWAAVRRGRFGRGRALLPRLSVLVAGTGPEVERCMTAVLAAPDLLAVGTADPWTAAPRVVHDRPDVCVCCGPDAGLVDRVRADVAALSTTALPATQFVRWNDVSVPALPR